MALNKSAGAASSLHHLETWFFTFYVLLFLLNSAQNQSNKGAFRFGDDSLAVPIAEWKLTWREEGLKCLCMPGRWLVWGWLCSNTEKQGSSTGRFVRQLNSFWKVFSPVWHLQLPTWYQASCEWWCTKQHMCSSFHHLKSHTSLPLEIYISINQTNQCYNLTAAQLILTT